MPTTLLRADSKLQQCLALARDMRKLIIERSFAANVGHVGSSLSVVDIVAALWGGIMRAPASAQPDRDRFLLSKGHAAIALYCAMRGCGLIDDETLATYCADGSHLAGHPVNALAGVDFSTGSLGQGLSVACGMAYGLRHKGLNGRMFVLLSDGECNEGQVWEAALFASHQRLGNICVVVDDNNSQCMGSAEAILKTQMPSLWAASGWQVSCVNGHDVKALLTAASIDSQDLVPLVVIAKTVLGKGIAFMEGQLEWHYRNLTGEQACQALTELGSEG